MPQFKLTFLFSAFLFGSLLLILPSVPSNAASYPELNAEQIDWLGEQIFNNECRKNSECLTSWNSGEDFPSLGIGHFIWYRADQKEVFEESFPALLRYFESLSVSIPTWLINQSYEAPWRDREQFNAEFNGPELSELRIFLQQQIPAQTRFIILRFEAALDKIIMDIPASEQHRLTNRFLQIANTAPPYGLYALIDYVNFKGEGASPLERYQEQGWGLRQVLENMSTNKNNSLQEFVDSATQVLSWRVDNSPPERNEARWLQGWVNRLNTYLPPPEASATEAQ